MNTPILKLVVPKEEHGVRLDVFCTHKIEGYSRSHFTKLASAKHIKLNGKAVKPSYKIKTGEILEDREAIHSFQAQVSKLPAFKKHNSVFT